jgi:adenine deaminase
MAIEDIIRVARGKKLADLVLKNGKIANVFSGDIYSGNVAIYRGKIIMLSSCVPSTNMETSGATLSAFDLSLLSSEKRVLGLGELMNYPGVVYTNKDVMAKLKMASGKRIDGHAPGLSGKDLAAYITAGIKSDHEEGHINSMIKSTIEFGIDPIIAIQLATINAAEYFELNDLGAISPGYRADLCVFNNFTDFRIEKVFKDGKLVAEDGKVMKGVIRHVYAPLRSTVNVAWMELKDMLAAAVEIVKLQGGESVVRDGKVLESLPLMSLSFLALPVIPEIRVTDRGVVDVKKFKLVPLFE